MINGSNEVAKVATGSLPEMNHLAGLLADADIPNRIVGDDLTAGLGSTLPGSVELWVLDVDAVRATELIRHAQAHHKEHGTHPPRKFPHPESDPKPDRSRGQHPMPEPYRGSP